MTHDTDTTPTAAHSLWTIARIQDVLTSPVLIRRFLFDLIHAPEHEVMNVFTSWRHVAATIEVNAAQQATPESTAAPAHIQRAAPPDHEPTQAPEQGADAKSSKEHRT